MTEVPADRRSAPRWTLYQGWIVALLLLVNVSSALDRQILSVLQEPIKEELKLTDTHLGLITGPAFALFYSLAGIPLARFAERMNRARLLTFALGLWSGMTALCGAAVGFVQLALCRIGVGMGEGGCHPIAQSLIANYFSARQRGLALAAYSLGPPVAGIIAPLLGGFVAYHYGWRAAFLVAGVPGLLLAGLILFTVREPRTHTPAARRGAFGADMKWLFTNKAFVWVFIAGAFNGIGIQGIGAFTTSYLLRVQGMDLKDAAVVVSLIGVMGFIGTFIGGFLADRFADSRGRSYVLVPALGAALSLVCYLAAFLSSIWLVVIGFILLANIATDMKNGPNFAAVQNIVPDRMRATSAAMVTLANNVVGFGLGALMVGMISDAQAASMFASGLGEFAQACPGGKAPAGAAAELVQACASASAEGLRRSLAIVSLVFIGAAAAFYMASRTITINED